MDTLTFYKAFSVPIPIRVLYTVLLICNKVLDFLYGKRNNFEQNTKSH